MNNVMTIIGALIVIAVTAYERILYGSAHPVLVFASIGCVLAIALSLSYMLDDRRRKPYRRK